MAVNKRLPSYFTSLPPFLKYFGSGFPIITYHNVAPRPRGARIRGLYLDPKLFDAQLRELQAAGFCSATLEEARVYAPGLNRRVVLTFDDGLREAYRQTFPRLQRYGFRAIQFLVADRIGSYNHWDTLLGEVEEPLMNAEEIREWLAAGHEIGSHTLTHPHLCELPPAAAAEEIASSKKKLEDRFGLPVKHFCYPYGEFNDRIVAEVANAGYLTACTVNPGINTAETPPHRLCRIMARHPTRNLRRLYSRFQ